MYKEAEDILIYRQTLLDNADGLYSKYKKNDRNQLSLFGAEEDSNLELKLKSKIDVNELLSKEREVLGLCISYNKLSKYQLIKSKICNTNLKDIFLLNENNKNLKFIGDLTQIKHMTAKVSGNKYAKLSFEDETGSYEFYLFGKQYKELIPKLFLNRVYLVKVNYNSDRGSASVSMITEAENFNVTKFISDIYIESDVFYNMVQLKPYIFKNMIGNSHNLYFVFNGKEIKAPYKININNSIVEDLINNGFNIIAK